MKNERTNTVPTWHWNNGDDLHADGAGRPDQDNTRTERNTNNLLQGIACVQEGDGEMRLHELKEGKIYIGEDGREYKILDNHLCYLDGISVIVVARLSALTQNFTPKKEEPIVQWYSVLAVRKGTDSPICTHTCTKARTTS